ncbi:putative transmembrane protein 170 [Rhizoctonia solani]|uniref:Putative transmembrane protein 170 n=1 Tax=Rhizoctonia solani TaxID=456999 RepID=A0A8H7IIL4_9AGAM|nr:putative transmembrane protein 170 [Rhizoctonia solani]
MSFQQLDNPFDGGGLTPPPGYVYRLSRLSTTPDSILAITIQTIRPREHTTCTTRLVSSHLSAESRETTQTRSISTPPTPEIYRFTLYWTLIFYASSFALCGTFALLVRGLAKRRAPKLFVTVVLAFILTGTFFAVVGSAIVGYVLAAIYSVGYFSMST